MLIYFNTDTQYEHFSGKSSLLNFRTLTVILFEVVVFKLKHIDVIVVPVAFVSCTSGSL